MSKVYFISDLHLGAKYIKDEKAAERRVVSFLHHIANDASDIYLLGDVLDYWYEYRTVVPRGYVRFLGALAQLADSGVKVHWYIGNHDIWLFDYLRNEIGMEVIDGFKIEEIMGSKFFLSHGDGVGKLPFGFKCIRSIFRNKICQKLYSAVHPRWTVPFAYAWSKSNREYDSYSSPQFEGIDKEPQAQFALQYLQDVDPSINYFIFGHRHVVADEALTTSCQLIILGDWITRSTYGVFDGHKFTLHEWEQKEN